MIVESVGFDDLKARLGLERLKRVARGLGSMQPVMRNVGVLMLAQNREHFDKARGKEQTGVSFGSIQWQPFKGTTQLIKSHKFVPSQYAKRKRAAGKENWLMVFNRGLMDSLTLRDKAGSVFRLRPLAVEVGTKMKVAGYNWDTRRTVFLLPSDREGILDIVVESLRSLWVGSSDRLRAAWARHKAQGSPQNPGV